GPGPPNGRPGGEPAARSGAGSRGRRRGGGSGPSELFPGRTPPGDPGQAIEADDRADAVGLGVRTRCAVPRGRGQRGPEAVPCGPRLASPASRGRRVPVPGTRGLLAVGGTRRGVTGALQGRGPGEAGPPAISASRRSRKARSTG